MAVLAAADAYIFVVPVEVLLIPAVLAHQRRWALIALWTTFGSAVGSASFAALTTIYGLPFVEYLLPGVMRQQAWIDSTRFLESHGIPGLALISLSPLPQHAAVAIMGLARINFWTVFIAVFIGRLIKYEFIAWALVHAPQLLRKLRILR